MGGGRYVPAEWVGRDRYLPAETSSRTVGVARAGRAMYFGQDEFDGAGKQETDTTTGWSRHVKSGR